MYIRFDDDVDDDAASCGLFADRAMIPVISMVILGTRDVCVICPCVMPDFHTTQTERESRAEQSTRSRSRCEPFLFLFLRMLSQPIMCDVCAYLLYHAASMYDIRFAEKKDKYIYQQDISRVCCADFNTTPATQMPSTVTQEDHTVASGRQRSRVRNFFMGRICGTPTTNARARSCAESEREYSLCQQYSSA